MNPYIGLRFPTERSREARWLYAAQPATGLKEQIPLPPHRASKAITAMPMNLLLALLAPTLFWAVYHYHKDRHQPEPLVNLLLLYGLGIGAGYIGLHAYAALELVGLRYDAYHLAETNRLGLFLYALGVIGIVEELVKFIPFWLVALRLRHLDEPVDGIIYASFIALGFASYENLYFLPGMDGGEALARAFASPLVHIMFASIWGYACGHAKLQGRPLLPAALQGLGLAALLHGIYDCFAIGLTAWVHVVPPLIILGIWIWRMRLIRWLHLQALQGEPQNPGGK